MNPVRLLQFIIWCQINDDTFLIFRQFTMLVWGSIAYLKYTQYGLLAGVCVCVCLCSTLRLYIM